MSIITKLKIRDFRGIAAIDINAASFANLFCGHNAQGKTSVLDAIAAAMKGKVPAEAVRHDHERAEILVELDDGTTIHRKIPASTDKKQSVKVQKDQAVLNSPQKFLDNLFSDEGMNPIAFIKAKDRQKKLLEALPITTTPAECIDYLEGVGLTRSDVSGVRTDSAHAFEVFEAIGKHLAGQRKAANAQVKQARQWIAQEREDLADIADPSEEIERLAVEFATARAEAAGRTKLEGRIERLKARRVGLNDAIAEAQKRLKDLEHQASELDKEIEAFTNDISVSTSLTNEQLADMESQLAKLNKQKVTWAEMQRRIGKVEAREAELEQLESRASALDAGVKFFGKDAPAKALAATPLPVDGLEYKDGAFYVNGTHLDQLSGAETIRVSAQFALERVRQKGLHVMCVDGLEVLDEEQRAMFFNEMADSGVQLWATEVDHGRSAPDGEGILYVVMQGGEPVNHDAEDDSEDYLQPGLHGLHFV